jgi:hypothetical protein
MSPTKRNIKDLKDQIWYYVNQKILFEIDSNDNGKNNDHFYNINQDDIIRFGDVKFYVKEIYLHESKCLDSPFYDEYNISELNKDTLPVFNFNYKAQILNQNTNEEDKICKICYLDSNDKDNPLVNICKICKGGIKYTHYKCLKKWINTKLEILENYNETVKTYNIENFNCDICKTPYLSKEIYINIIFFSNHYLLI